MMGERLGKWILSREIGRGGMGRVYLAREEVTGRQAAIKILSAELAQDAGFLLRFQREIETLSKLQHPNIVQFYDAGNESGYYFYAMEFIDGQNLAEILEAQTRVPWRDALAIAQQVCPALKHVHDHGIIHRDLKPSNILFRSDGVLKLTDFGIAKIFASSHLTQTGGVVGTAEYISPEQAQGKPATKRSDIYSLGIVLYYLITGKLPFEGTSFVDLLHKHRYGQFEKPSRLVPDLPYEIDDLLCQLLEKDPSKRPPDCMVLMKQLEALKKKLDRKDQATSAGPRETVAENKPTFDPKAEPGPATLMGRLVREELQRQNLGGPITQFFNHPWVIVIGFFLCLSVFAYALWPPTQESLYRHGSELMASNRLADKEEAWRDYLEPLNQRYPEHPYQEEVARFRRQLEQAREGTKVSEAERFFRLGERRLEDGDDVAAAALWQNVITAFESVDAERDWVQQARKRLDELRAPKRQAEHLKRVAPVLNQAAKLAADGKQAEAERLWSALETLYRNDPAGGEILQAIGRARKQ